MKSTATNQHLVVTIQALSIFAVPSHVLDLVLFFHASAVEVERSNAIDFSRASSAH
jgi:hypothetical protein